MLTRCCRSRRAAGMMGSRAGRANVLRQVSSYLRLEGKSVSSCSSRSSWTCWGNRAGDPDLEIPRGWDMQYEDYKPLTSRAKWTFTFGKGLGRYLTKLSSTAEFFCSLQPPLRRFGFRDRHGFGKIFGSCMGRSTRSPRTLGDGSRMVAMLLHRPRHRGARFSRKAVIPS